MFDQTTALRSVEEAEVDRSMIKIWILGLMTVAANGAAIYSFKVFIETLDHSLLWLVLVANLAFLTLAVLNILFIKSFNKIFLIIILTSILPLLLFYGNFSTVLAGGAVILIIYFVIAARRTFNISHNSLRFKFFSLVKPILTKIITGWLIFAATIFFVSYFDGRRNIFDERLTNNIIHQLLIASQPGFRFLAADFSYQAKLEDVLELLIKKQVESLTPQFEKQLPAIQQKIISEAVKKTKQNLSTQFKKLDYNKSVEDNVKNLIYEQLNHLTNRQKRLIATLVSILFFIVVKSISFLWLWFTELVTFVVFKFLLMINFARFTSESRNREFIILT